MVGDDDRANSGKGGPPVWHPGTAEKNLSGAFAESSVPVLGSITCDICTC